MDHLDEIFIKSYLTEYHEKEKLRLLNNQEDREIANKKSKELKGMISFLQKFVDLEIFVHHSDQYTKNALSNEYREPQKFNFYLVDSSKKWSPGTSILFDHPAQVEIAIPNKPEEEGVIVIKVASHHPYSYIVEQKFTTFDSAYDAIARFLGRSTVKINKDHRKIIQKDSIPSHQKQDNYDFIDDAPSEPPDFEESEPPSSFKKISDIFKIKQKNDNSTDKS